MSFWDAIANLFRGPSAVADGLPFAAERYAGVADTLPRFELGKARWPDFDVARYDTEAYRRVALVFRCLSLISHAAGTAKVRVYDEANDDGEIADHPMRTLIRQPNPRMGEARFWGTVALRMGVAGFCVVEKERNRLGDVIALNPLRSSWLKAKPRGRGVFDWEYRIPGAADVPTLDAEDVVAFTWADTPDGSPYGLPPLATVVRNLGILGKQDEYVGNLLDTGGVPMWMLIPDPEAAVMDDEELTDWEERFQAKRGGIARRGVPWYAEGIKDAKALSLNPDELAMEAVRDLSDLAICQAFGVPPRKAGIRVGLEHTTQNATASVEDGEFYRDTIVPLWSRLDDALTTGLLPDFEPPESAVSLEFDTSDVEALQEDRNAKAVWIVPAFTGGLVTRDAALTELGLPLPESPDYLLRSISVEAIPADDPMPEPDPVPAPLQNPPENAPNRQEEDLGAMWSPTARLSSPETDDDRADRARRAMTLIRATGHRPTLFGPSDGYKKRKAIGAANKRLIANVAEAREPSIRRFLKDQAERIAATVSQPLGVALARSNGHAMTAYSAEEIDWDAENAELERVLRLLYSLAGQTAYDAAADQLGIGLSFDLANPKVRAVMDKLASQIVGITQETRDIVAEVVTAGEEAGKSIAEIAADIRASTGFNAARANVIARTESMFGFGEASALAYKESGVVDRAQIFDNPGHTDAYGASDGLTCASRDGIVVPIDDMMTHIYADHPNGSACGAPVLIGED